MAECERCGRFSPPDRETGYDADTLCADCDEADEDANRIADEEEHGRLEPDDPDGPWGGGFAENH